jgi:hypothetical protein
MKYLTISLECPKSFKALFEWSPFAMSLFGQDLEYVADSTFFNDRDLYDFFDSKGILIYTPPLPIRSGKRFGWAIVKNDEKCTQLAIMKERTDTRQEAETAAFTRAFSLLEEQLTA